MWQCHLGLKLQEQEQEHFGMHIFLSEELGSKPWDQTLLDVELHLEYSEHFLDMETSLPAAKPCIEAPKGSPSRTRFAVRLPWSIYRITDEPTGMTSFLYVN